MDVKKIDVAIDKGVGAQYGQSTDAYSVGDSVPFRVTTAVPSYPADSKDATFTITDTPSAGLEIDTSSIQINGVAAATGADYTLTASPAGYTIAFTKAYVLAHPGDPIVVTYNATLTSAAFSHSADDLTGNTANVTFNPNPYESTTAGPADRTTVQTYGYVFKKTAPDGTPLTGAAFTIRLTNGTSVTSTSDAQGYVYFEDLAAGTYTAVETTIPSGYQKAPDQTFELSSATATADNPATAETENNYLVAALDVQDPKLPALPITGAAGVFLLVMVGAGLVVVGSVLGLRSRKEQ